MIDEAHHAAANSYKSILSYFKPDFTLGLTATPHRMDGEDLLKIFQNIGHKLDLKEAVEIGELTPIRCIRVDTNIDLSDVRINGIKYNYRDLESKLFIPDRNKVIVDTYIDIVKDKKTVIFCASVSHSETIANMLKEKKINAEAISGQTSEKKRKKILSEYEFGDINVLCACDLLNEGWDSPKTEVLFMARPTLSKTLYLQQLGRGMRISEGKDHVMVFDFIDNANLFNMPYSVHRVFDISEYRPGGLVAGTPNHRILEKNLIYKGEKPDALLDYPVDINNYQVIDLFNWQKEVEDMVSESELVRSVSAQNETVKRYIKDGLIEPDLVVPMGNRSFNYFEKDNIPLYADKFGWDLITPANIKNKFIEYVEIMEMSYSYKPVFLKAVLRHMNSKGMVLIEDIVQYFINYYENRREQGLIVEKRQCLYLREYTESEVKRNILANPFRRFQDMNFMDYHKEIEYIKVNNNIMKNLTSEEIIWMEEHSNKKLDEYFSS